jgi:hypothetical protein
MPFFAASEAPPRPESMKFPVCSLLAGNLAFSETSSQLAPPSSGESCANLHAGGAGPDGGESDRSWSATGARGGTASGGGGSWSATGARGCCRRCGRRSCNLGLYGVPAALLPATLRSSSAIVGTRAMPQWPRCPRSHPRNPRFSNSVSSRSVFARRCSRETATLEGWITCASTPRASSQRASQKPSRRPGTY